MKSPRAESGEWESPAGGPKLFAWLHGRTLAGPILPSSSTLRAEPKGLNLRPAWLWGKRPGSRASPLGLSPALPLSVLCTPALRSEVCSSGSGRGSDERWEAGHVQSAPHPRVLLHRNSQGLGSRLSLCSGHCSSCLAPAWKQQTGGAGL